MLKAIDDLFRSRWFWFLLLAAAYCLPALLVRIPVALAMPWVMIPNAYEGVLYACGFQYGLYGAPRLAVAIGFHLVFWTLCFLVVFRGRKLSLWPLRIYAVLLLVILAVTIHGCRGAIEAVRH
jgi:hypothetical protein